MTNQPDASLEGTDAPDGQTPEWLRQLRTLQAEDAVRFAGHLFNEEGWHDEDECRQCAEAKTVVNSCKCGDCCRQLILEVDVEDAEREPKIKDLGGPIYGPPDASGQRELAGYNLNRRNAESFACVFLDDATSRCSIYHTRPLICRLFDCDGEGKEQLIELGILGRELDGK